MELNFWELNYKKRGDTALIKMVDIFEVWML